MAFLEVSESGSTRRADLHEPTFTIGRSPDSGLVLASDAVSRTHAQIIVRDGRHLVEDLGSRNGTLLNGRTLAAPALLTDLDEVRIGVARIRYRCRTEPIPDVALGIRMRNDRASCAGPIPQIITAKPVGDILAASDRKQRVVLSIISALLQTYDLGQVLQKILKELLDIFQQADFCVLLLVDDSGDLVPRIVHHRSGRNDLQADVSITIALRVLNAREAILLVDAQTDAPRAHADPTDPHRAVVEPIADGHARSVLSVPLMTGDLPQIGVLQLHRERPGTAFTDDDLELLTLLAVAAATAIQNARMYERLLVEERLRHELEVARIDRRHPDEGPALI